MQYAPDHALIAAGLTEDVGTGDVTTDAIVPAALQATAEIVLREPGVVCGLESAFEVFRTLDPDIAIDRYWPPTATTPRTPRPSWPPSGHARGRSSPASGSHST